MPPLRASIRARTPAVTALAGTSSSRRGRSRAGARRGLRSSHVRRSSVNDSRMKDRVKGLLGTAPPGSESPEQPDAPPVAFADPNAQRQALQVLTLAQRTAEDHIHNAHRQADKICADARAIAEQIVRDAESPGRPGECRQCPAERRKGPVRSAGTG